MANATRADQQDMPINVSMSSILEELHKQYGRMITQLAQENAELHAGLDQLGQQLDELTAISRAANLGRQAFTERTRPGKVETMTREQFMDAIGHDASALTEPTPRELLEMPRAEFDAAIDRKRAAVQQAHEELADHAGPDEHLHMEMPADYDPEADVAVGQDDEPPLG